LWGGGGGYGWRQPELLPVSGGPERAAVFLADDDTDDADKGQDRRLRDAAALMSRRLGS
jgi:hypothetical protein